VIHSWEIDHRIVESVNIPVIIAMPFLFGAGSWPIRLQRRVASYRPLG